MAFITPGTENELRALKVPFHPVVCVRACMQAYQGCVLLSNHVWLQRQLEADVRVISTEDFTELKRVVLDEAMKTTRRWRQPSAAA